LWVVVEVWVYYFLDYVLIKWVLWFSVDVWVCVVFLFVNDMVLIVLCDLVVDVFGVDFLSCEGFEWWSAVLMDVYICGLFIVFVDEEG